MFAAAAFLSMAPQLLSGSVNLTVKKGNEVLGTAKVSFRITNSNGKFNQTKMDIRTGKAKVELVQESEYQPDGTPIRNFLRSVTSAEGKNVMESVTMTYSNGVAIVTIEKDGKKETKSIKPQPGSEIRRKDEFWFFTTKPKVGQTYVCRQFDPNSLSWVQLNSTYVGVEQLKLGNNTFKAHHIRTNRYEYWLDEKGAPLLLKSSSLTMVRE